MSQLRSSAIALAMLPPWAAYLAGLLEWPNQEWVNVESLRLAMGVEWVSAGVFPLIVVLWLDARPPRLVRLLLALASSLALTWFVRQAFGNPGAALFWINGGVTYIGWLWPRPDERRRSATILGRWLLTFGSLFPVLFTVIVLARVTGADSMLLLGFLYFLTLHVLEFTGTFARFQRWFVGLDPTSART